ncbi:CLUMA_CG006606, isoform A, partial [Clunio marinus]
IQYFDNTSSIESELLKFIYNCHLILISNCDNVHLLINSLVMEGLEAKTSVSTTHEKKTLQLDELPREDLILKCRNLLGIAKKAKAAKDEALNELKLIKATNAEQTECINSQKKSLETLQELIDSLTAVKLENVTKLKQLEDELKSKDKLKEELTQSINEASIEKEGLKRQVQRLSDENDSLLAQLQELENDQNRDIKKDHQTEVEKLNNFITDLSKKYEEKVNENISLQDLVEKNSTKIKKLIQEVSELREPVLSQDESLNSAVHVRAQYEKCVRKLKVYREKICGISERFELLKSDKDVLVSTTKEYSRCISKWQKEIAESSTRMIAIIKKSNQDILSRDEDIAKLTKKIQDLESSATTATESTNNSNQDFESEIQKLKNIIEEKEKSFEEERKKFKSTAKKPTVLDLEIEAYEKTLDELSKKLDAKKSQTNELEETIKVQNETMNSMKSQISTLEANLNAEKSHSTEIKSNLDSQLNLSRKSEHEKTETKLQLELQIKNYEALKLENGEIKLEMAQMMGDSEKRYQILESERNELLKNICFVESEVDKFRKLSSSQEKEIDSLRAEFSSYKIRAQNVLRQNQTKDLGEEQELKDEVITLHKTLEDMKISNDKTALEMESLKKNFSDVLDDKNRLQTRCNDLLTALEKQSDEVLDETRTRNQQHDEAIKAYQLQIDTLNAFYQKKVQETEEISATAIAELKAKLLKLEKDSETVRHQSSVENAIDQHIFYPRNEDQKISMSLLDREEAEGSEDQLSQSSAFLQQNSRKTSRIRDLMPLDELLNSSFDDNLNEVSDRKISTNSISSEIFENVKANLSKEQNRVSHLTMLLADAEKDLARMQQLNDLLKEEVRRQQRNFDREEHIKNSEYLKNIVVKFVTLNNGDEKQRLIPVLNTILKLSSEENHLLQNACKPGWALWSK